MRLTKQVGDKTVTVIFDARQPLPDEEMDQQQQGEQEKGEGEEEEQPPSENYCDFTVFVQEGNTGLAFECTTMDTEINFMNVQHSDDIATHMQQHRFERQLKSYSGPEFNTLDERIQTSLAEYMQGFGVNEHLAAFVECMSLDKDQRLYMKWLGQIKEFI